MLPDLRMAFAETIAKTHSHYSFGHETSWKMLEGIQLWRAYANFYGTCETNWNRSGSSERAVGQQLRAAELNWLNLLCDAVLH